MRQNDGRRAPTRRGPARLAPFAAFALAGLLAAAAGAQERPDAAERTVTLEDQTGIALTIYNENLALVRDRRRVVLDSGPSRLAFLGLSRQIRPETALLGAEGGLTVVEQTFRPGLLGPERLLETYVGETVRLVRTHPETGEERVEEAVLLSAAGPVLRVGDRVEIDPPGRIVLPAVPEGLRAQPSLVALVEGGGAGETPVELRYLTGGLSWQTDYVAELDPDEDRLSLRGWITLANGSGASYRNARISLVAGDVNQVQPYLMHDAARTVTMEMAAAPAPKREALFDYHLYRLDRPVTLGENETKQVALLSAENVPVEKEYRFVGLNQMYDHRAGEPRRASAVVRLSFENAKGAGPADAAGYRPRLWWRQRRRLPVPWRGQNRPHAGGGDPAAGTRSRLRRHRAVASDGVRATRRAGLRDRLRGRTQEREAATRQCDRGRADPRRVGDRRGEPSARAQQRAAGGMEAGDPR